MTNFDFLLSDPQFATFAQAAVTAEKSMPSTRRSAPRAAAGRWSLP